MSRSSRESRQIGVRSTSQRARPMLRLVVALLPLLVLPVPLSAQTVTGHVTAASGEAVSGAFVRLLDRSDSTVHGTLSDARGRFTLRAPAAGEYRLRAEMIGRRSHTSEILTLQTGSAVDVPVVLASEAIPLTGIEVNARARRCVVSPDAGDAAHRLWEEARKALDVAAWVEEARVLRFAVELETRELDPQLDLTGISERRIRAVSGRPPFASLPPEELATGGFVQSRGTETEFYAPDARTLVSDAFLEGHCFRAEAGPRDEPHLIGLAFSPVASSRLPDVDGVLWLDRETSELRRLEYSYRNLPRRYRFGGERVGGRVDFERLDNGGWFVRSWWIRMPRVALINGTIPELVGYVERAGVVGRVETAPVRTSTGAVTGWVRSDPGGPPIAGARVYLSGTSYATSTSVDGEFTIDGLRPGVYQISYQLMGTDAVGRPPPLMPVRVLAGEVTEIELVASPCGRDDCEAPEDG